MLQEHLAFAGPRLSVSFLVGDNRCTALDGMLDFINADKNPADLAQDLKEQLQLIADRGFHVPESMYKKLRAWEDLWEVRKRRFRMYGFVHERTLYLCTHESMKRQNRADPRLLRRTDQLRREWLKKQSPTDE